MLEEELRTLLPSADPAAPECAVPLIDLDHFKPVNDLCGHEAGDALLKAVTDRLGHIPTEGLRVFRLGGDEFVAIAFGAAATNWAQGSPRRSCATSASLSISTASRTRSPQPSA